MFNWIPLFWDWKKGFRWLTGLTDSFLFDRLMVRVRIGAGGKPHCWCKRNNPWRPKHWGRLWRRGALKSTRPLSHSSTPSISRTGDVKKALTWFAMSQGQSLLILEMHRLRYMNREDHGWPWWVHPSEPPWGGRYWKPGDDVLAVVGGGLSWA